MPFALLMAVIMAMIFMFASQKSESLIHRYSVTQASGFALDLGAKLAQRARWSYDIALADAGPKLPGLCASYGGVNTPVGAFSMCLIARKICVNHPRASSVQRCISPDDGTLLARQNFDPSKKTLFATLFSRVWLENANAALFSPAAPAGVTSNALTAPPVACVGGACAVTCSVNAHCITYRFCPLTTDCQPDELVWQTIGFLKEP
ncbi:MAG: hypothetical protein EOP05_05675 [Proteobacteria bacterium]|nr:MAG: hypothetical protein EOP05_05675 [Pseudomonadota bacterium]